MVRKSMIISLCISLLADLSSMLILVRLWGSIRDDLISIESNKLTLQKYNGLEHARLTAAEHTVKDLSVRAQDEDTLLLLHNSLRDTVQREGVVVEAIENLGVDRKRYFSESVVRILLSGSFEALYRVQDSMEKRGLMYKVVEYELFADAALGRLKCDMVLSMLHPNGG